MPQATMALPSASSYQYALTDQLNFYRPTLITMAAVGSMSMFGKSTKQKVAGAAVGAAIGVGVVLWMNYRLKQDLYPEVSGPIAGRVLHQYPASVNQWNPVGFGA